MNSKFLKTIGCLAIALALTACSSEENMGLEENTPVAIQFTAGIGAQTRAVDTFWEAGDAIGISCTSTTGSTNYTNMKYVTASGGTSGAFSYDGTNTGIFFKDNEEVTFSAYYPFTGTERTTPGKISVNTSDQTKSKEFDFLFAEGITTSLAKAANNSVPVNFNFKHKMCKLVLKIKSDASFTANDLKGGTYTLKNIKANGTFDTQTGIITLTDGIKFYDLVIPKTSMSYDNNNLLTCSIIVLPMQTPSRITATINGVTYSTSNTNFRFVSGNSYEYTITIKKTEVAVSDCTISPWGSGEAGSGSVEI